MGGICMRKRFKEFGALLTAVMMVCFTVSGCGSTATSSATGSTSGSETASSAKSSSATESTSSSGKYFDKDATVKEVLTKASEEGKIGNWGGGNEYELLALLSKYGLKTSFLSQGYDMDGFDDDSILLASVMTYNEKGLVKNSYPGGYGYGDKVKTIDFNQEGVGMLEDNIFCTKDFAKANPNTVKAFISASLKGWKDACADPEAAAETVYKYGSSVSSQHQSYMAKEVKKLVETDINGNAVSDDKLGYINDDAMQQTLDIFRKYVKLDDSSANDALQKMALDDFRDNSYWEGATSGDFGTPEKSDVTIQLKWLPQAQFMGYYVALDKGYYKDLGLNVTITPGGGDIGETTAVYTGQADFGTTWPATLISADASGMGLLEVAQIYQRSGLQMVYKINQ
jgi:NitT/TauT family transport system substrate-binding protein